MKLRLLFVLNLALALSAASIGVASADTIAQFTNAKVNNANYIIPPLISGPNTVVTNFTPSSSALSRRGSGFANYRGWGTSFDLQTYVAFTVAPTAGFQLNLTDFTFSTASEFSSDTSFAWAMRVDTGSGYGAWTFDQTYSGLTDSSIKTWDFSDFTTTGTVQFALFGTVPDSVTAITAFDANPVTLVGTTSPVSAVPEPSSTTAIIAFGVCAFALLRRKIRANS